MMILTKKHMIVILVLTGLLFVSCNDSSDPVSSNNDQTEDNNDDGSNDNGNTGEDGNDVEDGNDSNDVEYTWDSNREFTIELTGAGAVAEGPGATANQNIVTIKYPGTYLISGDLDDGRIIVNTEYDDDVVLVMNGINISSSVSSPLYILNAKDTIIILADNSENCFRDAVTYTYDDAEKEEPNAAIFSNDDLLIRGNGSLTVYGYFNDGITSEDDLIIESGTINVYAKDDGIRGKDSITVKNGSITIESGGDGLKSDNESDTTKGFIEIENGTFTIMSCGDAIAAAHDIRITDGTFTIVSGGGNTQTIYGDSSSKGIKGLTNVVIHDGHYIIDSSDDAIHSNEIIEIYDGTFQIASGDDALHSDTTMEINGGDILISKSYEGLESGSITINDGTIRITSSDDGINLAGGVDGSGMGGRPGQPSQPGQGGFEQSGDYHLYMNGGYIVVDADGDGVDSNGTIDITGGTLLINGPTSNNNGALDSQGNCTISGGLLVAAGSAGMAEAPGQLSSQYSVLVNFRSTLNSGTLFTIRSSKGEDLVCFSPSIRYQSIVFSSPDLTSNESYDIYYGGSSDGTDQDGIYIDGTYSPGTKYTSFTVSNSMTTIIR